MFINNIKKILPVFLLLLAVSVTQAQYHSDYLRQNLNNKPFEEIQRDLNEYYATHFSGKGSGYKPWKRYEWWAKQHLNPQGKLENAELMSRLALNQFPSFRNGQQRSTGIWTVIGPTWNQGTGTGNGRPNCIAFHPTNPNAVYVGFPQGGMWLGLLNGGGSSMSWSPLTDDLPTSSISSIAINPNNPYQIFLLTGDGNRTDGYSIGMLRSDDGGANWQQTGLTFTRTQNQFGYKILINPLRTNTMFVCTNGGIYRSYDGGNTFDTCLLNTNFYVQGCYDIEYAPNDTTRMVASGFASVFSSSNGGVTWFNRSANLPVDCRRTALAVSPNGAAGEVWLYCGGRDSAFVSGSWVARYKGLYKSTDYGVNYTRINNSPNISGYNYNGGDFAVDQSNIDMDIAVNPANKNIVMAGTHNIWKSSNSGASFGSNPVSHWSQGGGVPYIHEDINFITYHPTDGSVYVGSDGGVYRSTDNGATWTDLTNGLVISQFYRINTHPTNNNIIVNGAQDAAGNVRVGATTEFKELNGGDGMSCMIDYRNSDTVYTSYNEDVYRTVLSNNNQVNIKPAAVLPKGYWITPIAMNYTTPGNLFFSSKNPLTIYRSNNYGASWSVVNGGASVDLITCPSNVNFVYAANTTGILRSENAQAAIASSVSWNSISSSTPTFPDDLDNNTPITRITVNPADEDEIWFSAGGYNDTLKVYRSNNKGNNWINMSAGLPNIPILCIAFQKNGAPGSVYVGTDIGVFYRDDNLGQWIPYSNGLPIVPVTDIRFNDGISRIRIATYGRGIWESPMYQPCLPNLLIGNSIGGVLNYEASNSITATATLTQGVGTKVQLKAGNFVDILPGAVVSGGSILEAKIAPCGTGFEVFINRNNPDTIKQTETQVPLKKK